MTRRTYQRLYARRRRAANLNAARQAQRTCPHRHGSGRCGGVLLSITNGRGEHRVSCPLCERRLAGICRDCPARVAGRVGSALRCATCKPKAVRAQLRRYAERHREELNRRGRLSYRDRAVRERRNEYKRLWRKLNRDKVRAQKRRAALRGYGQEYQAKRRERDRQEINARERSRQRGIVEYRTCVTPGCTTVVRGRVKKCSLCKATEAQRATELLASHRGRGRRTDLEHAA